MAKSDSNKDKPFHVVTTTTNTFRSGHDTEDEAKAACTWANNEATGMGLDERYKVKAKKS